MATRMEFACCREIVQVENKCFTGEFTVTVSDIISRDTPPTVNWNMNACVCVSVCVVAMHTGL